jgi:Mg2+/Co2+ transporter CorC
VPSRGEKISLGDFEFTVLRADTRRVFLLGLLISECKDGGTGRLKEST